MNTLSNKSLLLLFMISLATTFVALAVVLWIFVVIYGISPNQPAFARNPGWFCNLGCLIPIVVGVATLLLGSKWMRKRQRDALTANQQEPEQQGIAEE